MHRSQVASSIAVNLLVALGACGGEGPTSVKPDQLTDAFLATQTDDNPLRYFWRWVVPNIDSSGTLPSPTKGGAPYAAVGLDITYESAHAAGQAAETLEFAGVLGWSSAEGTGEVDAMVVVGSFGFSSVRGFHWTRSGNAEYVADELDEYEIRTEFTGPPSGPPPHDCGVTIEGAPVTCSVSVGTATGRFGFTANRTNGPGAIVWPTTTFTDLPTLEISITDTTTVIAAVSLSGTYTGTVTGEINGTPAGSASITFTLAQSGDDVTGTWSSGLTYGTITGTVSGDSATFSITQEGSCPGTFTGNAAIENDGDRLSGSYAGTACVGSVSATFVVTRTQAG